MKVLIAICVLILTGAVWAQSAMSESSKPTLKIFISPDGTFRITYPDLLIRCERDREQPGCLAYIPPCDGEPLLCLAYPPKGFAHNPTFDAAVLTVWELNWSKKECLADSDHPLKPISIRGVKFKGGESADAAMNRTRNSKGYNAYHNGKCYGLTITTVTTSGAVFDPPVKELSKHEWEEVDRPLKQARDSFVFLK